MLVQPRPPLTPWIRLLFGRIPLLELVFQVGGHRVEVFLDTLVHAVAFHDHLPPEMAAMGVLSSCVTLAVNSRRMSLALWTWSIYVCRFGRDCSFSRIFSDLHPQIRGDNRAEPKC